MPDKALRMICERRIRLIDETTGEVFYVPCGATDPAFCEGCAAQHAGDVRALIREGVADAGVATFITLTAPGSLGGATHSSRGGRPCPCGKRHGPGDALVGVPLDPDGFDYAEVVRWNIASRRLLSVALQKLARLLGRPVTWVGVPELQARGATHWHILVRGGVPRWAVDLAINGGVNPSTGRRIQPTTHAGQRFGPVFDVQILADDSSRMRAAAYVAKYVSKGLGAQLGVLPPEQELHRYRLAAETARLHKTAQRSSAPAGVWERMPFWARHAAPAHRRAARTGHPGRTFGRSRRWPVTFADCRARRQTWREAQGLETLPARRCRYDGRAEFLPTLLARCPVVLGGQATYFQESRPPGHGAPLHTRALGVD